MSGREASALAAPTFAGLRAAIVESAPALRRAAQAREGRYVNQEGGDVASTGNHRSLVHHVANYLAAAELAEQVEGPPEPAGSSGPPGPVGAVVDVGSGVGGLGSWLAARLRRPLHLVDADTDVRAVAARAFPDVQVHDDLASAPRGAFLVTAMEVIEHIPRDEQLGFVRGMADLLAPGGLLVCSTPDESGYLGGWSGYAPHVGTVDGAGLEHLLVAGTGAPAVVWRLEGPAFAVGGVRRVLEPVGNRAWAGVQRVLPGVAARAASGVGARGGSGASARRARQVAAPAIPSELLDVRAVPARQGSGASGSGLLGVVIAPA